MVNNASMNPVVNSEFLKTLVERSGGSVAVSYEADVGHSTLIKLMAGTYSSLPRKKLREKLAGFFKVQESSLFPFVDAKGFKKAS